MTVQRDWFGELLERWRREIASEPYRHSTELRDAISKWVARQQAANERREHDQEEWLDP